MRKKGEWREGRERKNEMGKFGRAVREGEEQF